MATSSNIKVFLSVGRSGSPEQEGFTRAIEERLRVEGLEPQTVGRTAFDYQSPLKAATELMDQCAGVVVLALERIQADAAVEWRGGANQVAHANLKVATPWNQIEATMAYTRGLPTMVICAVGVRQDGLLEPSNDWWVQTVEPVSASLSSAQFSGVLAKWKERVAKSAEQSATAPAVDSSTVGGVGAVTPSKMPIGQLVKTLTLPELFATGMALVTLLGLAFTLGARMFPGLPDRSEAELRELRALRDSVHHFDSITTVLRTAMNRQHDWLYITGADFTERGAQARVIAEIDRIKYSFPTALAWGDGDQFGLDSLPLADGATPHSVRFALRYSLGRGGIVDAGSAEVLTIAAVPYSGEYRVYAGGPTKPGPMVARISFALHPPVKPRP